MRTLPGLQGLVTPPVRAHQGGWDEILLFFGLPVALFVFLRWLGMRRDRREAQEQARDTPDTPGD